MEQPISEASRQLREEIHEKEGYVSIGIITQDQQQCLRVRISSWESECGAFLRDLYAWGAWLIVVSVQTSSTVSLQSARQTFKQEFGHLGGFVGTLSPTPEHRETLIVIVSNPESQIVQKIKQMGYEYHGNPIHIELGTPAEAFETN